MSRVVSGFLRRCQILASCLGCVVVLGGPLTGQTDEGISQFFLELRRRALFAPAERYAMHRLVDQALPAEQRAVYAAELGQTLFLHGVHAAATEREEFWATALEMLRRESEKLAASPWRVLTETQRAWLLADEVVWLGDEVEIRPWDAVLVKRLQERAGRAKQELAAVQVMLQTAIDEGTRTRDALPLYKMNELQNETAWRQTSGQLVLAEQGMPAGSDRAATVLQAEKDVRELLGSTRDPELAARTRVLQVKARRLMGDLEAAERTAQSLADNGGNLSPEVAEALLEQVVLLHWARQRPDLAATAIVALRQKNAGIQGDTWLLQLQTLVRLQQVATQANDTALADEFAKELDATVLAIDARVGGVWSRRARDIQEAARSHRDLGGELTASLAAVRAARSAGKMDAALELLADAIATARKNNQQTQVFDLSWQRGTLWIEAARWQEAADQFRQTAELMPDHPRAADASLLAAWALGRLYDERATRTNREAYQDELARHRVQFPDHPTHYDAVWMEARLAEQRLQASQALPLYLSVPKDHPRVEDAAAGAARCFVAILRRAHHQQVSALALQNQARDWFRDALLHLPKTPREWSVPQGEVVACAAEFATLESPPDWASLLPLCEQLDQAAALSDEKSGTAWLEIQARTAPIRVVAWAATGESAKAQAGLESLTELPSVAQLNVLRRLQLMQSLVQEPSRQRQLRELRLSAAERFAPHFSRHATPLQRQEFAGLHGLAELETGETAQGIARLQELLDHQPGQPLLLMVANALESHPQTEAQKLRLQIWRRVEQEKTVGSADWMTARLAVIAALIETKDVVLARKLMAVTEALYPKLLAAPEFQGRVDSLRKSLQGD